MPVSLGIVCITGEEPFKPPKDGTDISCLPDRNFMLNLSTITPTLVVETCQHVSEGVNSNFFLDTEELK